MVKEKQDIKKEKKTCFVIMPISDPDDYEPGHFERIYSHLIKPACEQAGFTSMRADDVKNTNYIIIDILKRILNSDLVICDLSSRNPNVLYELGIRQAFNKPSVLIKDSRTERIFDIQGIRTVDYDENLRIDMVQKNINTIKVALEHTYSAGGNEINSLIQILGVPAAEVTNKTEISPETSLILSSLKDISQRITKLEDNTPIAGVIRKRTKYPNALIYPPDEKDRYFTLPNGQKAFLGSSIVNKAKNEYVGELVGVDDAGDVYLVKNSELIKLEGGDALNLVTAQF